MYLKSPFLKILYYYNIHIQNISDNNGNILNIKCVANFHKLK